MTPGLASARCPRYKGTKCLLTRTRTIAISTLVRNKGTHDSKHHLRFYLFFRQWHTPIHFFQERNLRVAPSALGKEVGSHEQSNAEPTMVGPHRRKQCPTTVESVRRYSEDDRYGMVFVRYSPHARHCCRSTLSPLPTLNLTADSCEN